MAAYTSSLVESLTNYDSLSVVMPTWFVFPIASIGNLVPEPDFSHVTTGLAPALWSGTPQGFIGQAPTSRTVTNGGVTDNWVTVTCPTSVSTVGISIQLSNTINSGQTVTANLLVESGKANQSFTLLLEDNLLGNGAQTTSITIPTTLTSRWMSVTWTPTADSPHPRLYIYTPSPTSGDQFFVRKSIVSYGSSIPTWADGDSPGWLWQGVAGQSSSGPVSPAESLSTSDTLGHQFTAVRPLTDHTGTSTLGIVNLPLLFTYLPPGAGTDLGARQVQQSRQAVEAVTVSETLNDRQSLIFGLSETLSANDSPVVLQTLHRQSIESIPFAGDSVTKRLQASRRTLDQIGNDKLISPMLAFPAPNNDVVARISGHARHPIETLTFAELVRWLSGFSRHYIETLTTSDVTTRRLNPVHRGPFEVLTTSDSTSRLVGYRRVIIEQLTTVDASLRLVTLHRIISDALTTNDVLGHLHSAPRATTDTLTTSDHITTEQLLQAIMGYIWVANDGSVQAQLPDWTWVLAEDPITGNVMNRMPTATTTRDPTRSK